MLSCRCSVEWLTTYSNLIEYDRHLHNDRVSLANSVLISLFSILTLLAGGTKTVVLVEAILKEERPYPKPVQSEADFFLTVEHFIKLRI